MVNVEKLREIVGEDWVITKWELMLDYMEDAVYGPVRPKPAGKCHLGKTS